MQRTHLLSELNHIQPQIEDLQERSEVLKQYRQIKHIGDELKALSGRQKKKYRKEHSYEISQYSEVRAKVLELYPSGQIPTVEKLEQQIKELTKQRDALTTQYRTAEKKARELAEATQAIEQYLRQEQTQEQQKRKKRNDLE